MSRSQKLKTSFKTLTAFCGMALASHYAQAGAWVPAKGEGYGKVAVASYSADSFFGDNADLGEFKGTNLSYYGEYGLGNNFAIYGSLLAQDIEQTDAAGNRTTSSGFGDTEVGVRYQWTNEDYVLSTSFLVKLPYLYDDEDELPRGNGQNDYEAKVLFGKSLNEYGYLGLEFGYRLRAGAPSDEYRYLIEYGYSVNDNLYLRTKLDGTASANNADNVGQDGNLSQTTEFDIGKLELTAGWNFGKERARSLGRWGAEITYTKDIYGDNTLDGDSLQLGITRVF